LVVGIAVALCMYTLRNVRQVWNEYGFVGQCGGGGGGESSSTPMLLPYSLACWEAEAFAWEKLNEGQSLCMDQGLCTAEDCSSFSEHEKAVPLYTMHSLLDDQATSLVPLDVIVGTDDRQQRKSRKKRRKAIHWQHPEAHDFEEVESEVQ
jgi:hypothetical protein